MVWTSSTSLCAVFQRVFRYFATEKGFDNFEDFEFPPRPTWGVVSINVYQSFENAYLSPGGTRPQYSPNASMIMYISEEPSPPRTEKRRQREIHPCHRTTAGGL